MARLIGVLVPMTVVLAVNGQTHPVVPRAGERPTPSSVVVVMDDNYPPYVFRNADGHICGILPDQWALWSVKTGWPVELRAMDWAAAQRCMRDGQADVIDTIFHTPERALLYDFTSPYAQIEVPIFAHVSLGGISDLPSLRGFTVGVKAADSVVPYLNSRGIDNIRQYPSYEAIILAAKNHEIKVFSVDAPAGAYYLYKHGVAHEFRRAFVLYTGQFHRAVHKHRPDLLQRVQSGFGAISRREYRAIERKWMGNPFWFAELIRHWGYWLLAGLAVLLALGGVILALHLRVRAKTVELRQALKDVQQSLAMKQRSEAALREQHEMLKLFIQHSPIFAYIKEVTPTESRTLLASDNFRLMTGLSGAEMAGKTMPEVFPADFAAKITADDWRTVLQGDVLTVEEELNGRCYTTIKFPIIQQNRRLLAGYTIDQTDRKRAEAEKAEIQAQLTTVQKLESVGRLAGGVAHDFNNMLQVIVGNTELALAQVPATQPLHGILDEIFKVAHHSATLIRQLQTFASRQPVAPQVINLNDAIRNMSDLLRRLLGHTVRLECRLSADLGSVKLDPGQIDQVIANLCINARDAIALSGCIVVTTRNIEIQPGAPETTAGLAPGAAVQLTVQDDGAGIPRENIDKIFEPFFTTKAMGKGSGLGLSIVYGIVHQNGGSILVDSDASWGTRFEVCLPRCEDIPPSPVPLQGVTPPSCDTAPRATILLVDDEVPVLRTTTRMLEQLGYQVLAAASTKEALLLFDTLPQGIDLLISDVLMPIMSGPAMLRMMRRQCPGLKSLFISGHTSTLLSENGLNDPEFPWLAKPFSRVTLAQKVREVLEQG